jgi:hypothetical protein
LRVSRGERVRFASGVLSVVYSDTDQRGMNRPSWGALLCGLIPFAGMCFSVPLWDRVEPMLFGIPFNLFWLLSWIVLTPACMWTAYRIEARNAKRHGTE